MGVVYVVIVGVDGVNVMRDVGVERSVVGVYVEKLIVVVVVVEI